MVGREDVVDPHDASVLMAAFGADVQHDHSEVVVEVAEAQLSPDVLLS